MEAERGEPASLTGTITVRVALMQYCSGAFVRLLLVCIVCPNTDDSFTLNGLLSALLLFEIDEPPFVCGVIKNIESAPCRSRQVTEPFSEFLFLCIRRQYGLDNVLGQEVCPDPLYVFGSRLFCNTYSLERKSGSLPAWRVFISVANMTLEKTLKKGQGDTIAS